jgi:hypothetical protein
MLNGDNVIPLWPDRDCDDEDLPVSIADLGGAVDAIGRCLDAADLEEGAGFGGMTVTSFLLHAGVVEQRLEELAAITVTTWPDVRWALHFASLRVRTLAAIRDSAAALSAVRSYSTPSRALDGSAPLGGALREVRDLIIQRYPQTSPVCRRR